MNNVNQSLLHLLAAAFYIVSIQPYLEMKKLVIKSSFADTLSKLDNIQFSDVPL